MTTETRFGFGKNWHRYLSRLNEDRIRSADASLREMLQTADLNGQTFLDAGSGSGLFSLSARRLGARVHSFDYDADSVSCTEELRRRYFGDEPQWTIERGSVLDERYLASLGNFDVVYSWGVLHHTGDMWRAIDLISKRVSPNGHLFIALYNDQGRASRWWTAIKRAYCQSPKPVRALILLLCLVRLWGMTFLKDTLRGHPFKTWRNYGTTGRGMSAWVDLVDWVGGYPFQVAKPDDVVDFLRTRGFSLKKTTSVGAGSGCNEFVFKRH